MIKLQFVLLPSDVCISDLVLKGGARRYPWNVKVDVVTSPTDSYYT